MSGLRVLAHAKVNLSLEVLGKRPDGFHEVRSVMQSIGLADELTFDRASKLTLECNVRRLAGEENLVMRAARLLQKVAGCRCGARISLRKSIPEAAGLGGASSDAAASLVGLSCLWGLGTPEAELERLAADLGSDVPFFLKGGTALVKGRGEVVLPLPDAAPRWLVLVAPMHSLARKTATLYGLLSSESWSSGERTARLVDAITKGCPVDEGLLGNIFESVAGDLFPDLACCRAAMLDAGAPAVHLSGAGPALFSLFPSEDSARAVAGRLTRQGLRPWVVRTLAAREARPCPVVTRLQP